jgi:hypothetical protein
MVEEAEGEHGWQRPDGEQAAGKRAGPERVADQVFIAAAELECLKAHGAIGEIEKHVKEAPGAAPNLSGAPTFMNAMSVSSDAPTCSTARSKVLSCRPNSSNTSRTWSAA